MNAIHIQAKNLIFIFIMINRDPNCFDPVLFRFQNGKIKISTCNGYGGVYFTLKGNTATANQFFITDSVKHFLRGALYFSATPNADSLQPVNNFLKTDVEHLINTLKFK